MIFRVAVLTLLMLVSVCAQLGSFSFAKTVGTAGTRVALSSSKFLVRGYAVVAKPTNTGYIYVGGSDVTNANGNRLAATMSEGWLPVAASRPEDMYDLGQVYIDSSVDGEGVIVRYVR